MNNSGCKCVSSEPKRRFGIKMASAGFTVRADTYEDALKRVREVQKDVPELGILLSIAEVGSFC
jgi:hypothetical protein